MATIRTQCNWLNDLLTEFSLNAAVENSPTRVDSESCDSRTPTPVDVEPSLPPAMSPFTAEPAAITTVTSEAALVRTPPLLDCRPAASAKLSENSNPILRFTVPESRAIKAGWWLSPVTPRIRPAPTDDVPVEEETAGTAECGSYVQIETLAESPQPQAVRPKDRQWEINTAMNGQSKIESTPSSFGNLVKYDYSCDICGKICFPGELSRDNKCEQCSNANDLDDNYDDETLVACNFCKSIFSMKDIDCHEDKCQMNPVNTGHNHNLNRSRNLKRTSDYRRCLHCKHPIQEDLFAEHEHDCFLNPFNKASRDAAKRLEMEKLLAEFRKAPNPEPADWGYIPSPRANRSTERRSDRYELVAGIGLEDLPIPCEFCCTIFSAQFLYQHENLCLANPINDRGLDVTIGGGVSYDDRH